MRRWLRVQLALGAVVLCMALANMSDRTNVVAPTMDFWFHGSAAPTTPTQPYKLRLMTAVGSNTSNGTEASGNGYTAAGNTMGNPAFGANASGVSSSNNSVSFTASGGNLGGGAILGVEIWDTRATPVRIAQGGITSVTVGTGNTLTFAAAAVTADASQW
jgi:hypothetical protein